MLKTLPTGLSGELLGEIMKSFMTFSGAICVAAICSAVPNASALVLEAQAPKSGSSLTIPIMLAVVVLCVVVGVVLRSFSRPQAAELSLNQRTK